MAGYFKKRRGNSGPNKNEEKVARSMEQKRQARSGEPLGQRFPTVDQLTVQLDILSPQQHPLSSEKRIFRSADPCRFSVPCPGRCGVGSFDLASKIEQVVETKGTTIVCGGKCQVPLYAGAAETCSCELKCRIEITYHPEPVQPEPQPVKQPVP